MEEPSEAAVQRFYAAFKGGDQDGVRALLAEDVVFHVPGTGILAGDHHGKEAVIQAFQRAAAETGGTFRTEPIGTLANRTYVAYLQRWTATRGRASVDMRNLIVYRVRDGQIAERWEFLEDLEGHDRFWT
jgi:ketosteroid isomerase-like protein